MKLFYFLSILFLLGACKSNQVNSYMTQLSENQIFMLDKCEENANCSMEIIPNSKLLFKEDQFNNGFIEIEKGQRSLVKYEFKRKELPNTADGHYSEIVFLEIENINQHLSLQNDGLQDVNMIYGRLCFCKGSSGYFKVKKGDLDLVVKKNQLTLKLNFSVDKIPQVITNIDETIALQN